MEWVHLFLEWISDGSKHFLLASFSGLVVALLGFWLISTIYYVVLFTKWIAYQPKVVGYFILIYLLLLALATALLSHWLLDYFSTLYNAPLGPPLQLDKGFGIG